MKNLAHVGRGSDKKCGVPERTRTSDLWLRRPALYPLSYGHVSGHHRKQCPRPTAYHLTQQKSNVMRCESKIAPYQIFRVGSSTHHLKALMVCHSSCVVV